MHFLPEEASTFAGHVDALYLFLIFVTAFFSLLIGTLVVVFAIKYRRKSPDEIATDVHESGVLEIIWTVIPFGLTIVMFFWGASVYFHACTTIRPWSIDRRNEPRRVRRHFTARAMR